MLNIVKDFYDFITKVIDRHKKSQAIIIKVEREKRHFCEWLKDREDKKEANKERIDKDYNSRGLYNSGGRIAAQKNNEELFKKEVERKIEDVSDKIKLIELNENS